MDLNVFLVPFQVTIAKVFLLQMVLMEMDVPCHMDVL